MNFDYWRHYARGWLLHFFGRPEQAYSAFAEALHNHPQDVQAMRYLAAIAAVRQRWDLAESWLEGILAVQQTDADAWFNLGFVRERADKAAAAIAAFDEAVRQQPTHDRAWYGMGLAYARLGQHGDAVIALQSAVRLQPMNGEAYYQLGMALHHAQRPDEVKAVFEKLLGFEPRRARQLMQDCGRIDLLPLLPGLSH